jgi:hypothetical protein
LSNAATVGDTITTISFYVSSVLNALPTTGGTIGGNLVVTGTETVPTITSPASTALTLQTNNGTTALTLTSAGYPLTPLRPAFLAYGASSTNFSSSTTAIYSPTSTNINVGNCFNTSTSTFTAPVTGIYSFGGMARVDASTSYIYMVPSLNGSVSNWIGGTQLPGLTSLNTGNTSFVACAPNWIMSLNAGDTVKPSVTLGGSFSVNFNAQCFWTGYLIG